MTRYDGSIRVQVFGTTEREVVPDVTIEDIIAEDWTTSIVAGAVPVQAGDEPAEVHVELMDGDHAGWSARGRASSGADGIEIAGTEAFMRG